jgi:hypothetical protein
MDFLEIRWESVDCIDLDKEKDQWWTLVNMVMNFWVP